MAVQLVFAVGSGSNRLGEGVQRQVRFPAAFVHNAEIVLVDSVVVIATGADAAAAAAALVVVFVEGLSFSAENQRFFQVPLELFRIGLQVEGRLILSLENARKIVVVFVGRTHAGRRRSPAQRHGTLFAVIAVSVAPRRSSNLFRIRRKGPDRGGIGSLRPQFVLEDFHGLLEFLPCRSHVLVARGNILRGPFEKIDTRLIQTQQELELRIRSVRIRACRNRNRNRSRAVSTLRALVVAGGRRCLLLQRCLCVIHVLGHPRQDRVQQSQIEGRSVLGFESFRNIVAGGLTVGSSGIERQHSLQDQKCHTTSQLERR
mmetsp:Transcript_29040/g.68260  ORF Transcript_29040/g.68260 Transcript_29040/m.68260 type:complete len:316 (-) Transcript_29040:704-1651(-)